MKPYGGLQENQGQGIILWGATSRQAWAATAYLRMVLLGLAGMRFDTDGIRFQPCVPKGISSVALRNLSYRRMNLAVTASTFWRAEEYHQRYLEKRGLSSCRSD